MKPLIIFVLTFLFFSCSITKVIIESGRGKIKDYEIGEFHSGCCGCVALYYSLFAGNDISKQLICEVSCGMGDPTVFSFTKDPKGDIQEVHRFIAVSDSTAAFKFNTKEKTLLTKLDSIVAAEKIQLKKDFKFSNLTGYREKLSQEQFHIFWIDKKGKSRSD